MKNQKGNFINSMFIYECIRKSDNTKQKYFGIHEVVKGGNFAQNRAIKKYETHIEKVLSYPIKNKKKEISHMSLQSFSTFLNKTNRVARDESDDKYYPFVLEFEVNKKSGKMKEVYHESLSYINHLNREFNVDFDDIVIIINNNKSVYIWVNPKVFGLKPCKDLHKVYTEMYKYFKEELGLKYVDESVVNSSYRLIKTPGSFYRKGYVVNIALNELWNLVLGNVTREELTKKQRDIRKLKLKNLVSFKLSSLYKKSVKKVNKKEQQAKKGLILPGERITNRPCINRILKLGMIEKGHRNDLLVALAIGLRDAGFTQYEIKSALEQKAIEWNHDESLRAVRNKVKTLINRDTNFSCDKAKMIFEAIGMEDVCTSCTKSEAIWLSRNVIDELYLNNASIRHYEAYLNLEKYGLIGRSFDLKEAKTTERTLKELVKLLRGKLVKENNLFKIEIKREKAKCKLPLDFIGTTFKELGNNIKQYLFILIKAYDGNENTAYISMELKNLSNYLGYKEHSTYKLIKKFENKGFLKINKNQGITLFYKTYKVININKIKEDKGHTNKGIERNKQVVNGIQLKFNIANKDICVNNEMVNKVINDEEMILNKGSCITYEIRGRGNLVKSFNK